jgi:hypothetical protein
MLIDQIVDSILRLKDNDNVDAFDEFQLLNFDPICDLEPAQYVNLNDSSSNFS